MADAIAVGEGVRGRPLGQSGGVGARSRSAGKAADRGAQGRNRTADTGIFNPLLYQLSYLGAGSAGNWSIFQALSTPAWPAQDGLLMVAKRVVVVLVLSAVVAACGAQEIAPTPVPAPALPPAPPSSAAPFQSPAVAPPVVAGEGTITRVATRESVPLTGPRVEAKAGDWLLESGQSVAVVSAEGRVVDLGSRGERDEITAIDPTVFLGLDPAHVEIVSIDLVGDEGRVLHVVRRVLEKPLVLHAFVSFVGDLLRVETVVTASAPMTSPVVVTLGERVGWSNVPTWAAGHGFITRAGTFVGDFLARDSYGAAYAMCVEGGRIVARFDSPDSGFHEAASTGEAPEIVVPDAPTKRRVIIVSHARGSLGKAAMALPCTGPRAAEALHLPEGLPRTAHVEVARCPTGGRPPAPYARFLPEETAVVPPAGCLQMRLSAPGHASSPWFPSTASVGRTSRRPGASGSPCSRRARVGRSRPGCWCAA